MRFGIFFITLFILYPAGGRTEIDDPSIYLKKNVVHKKLDNGINVLLLDRGYSPTLAFEISFKVGSVDETYRTIGAAHLLEHMLFKGTDKIGTVNYKKEKVILDEIEAIGETLDKIRLINPKNSMIPDLENKLRGLQKENAKYIINAPYDSIYTANGGIGFNASTSRDKTGYYIELPSSQLELWARLESERLRNPVFREYYLERNNVVEERLMRYSSNGEGTLYEQFLAMAFAAHPYRHPTIGWESNIPNLSIREVRDFYRDYYIPSRMTIAIVGKQNVNETFETVRKFFSGIESRPEPREVAIKEPFALGETRFAVNFESKPHLIIGWHKPSFPSKDDYAFDIFAEMLAGGKSSILYKSLILDKKILSSISSWSGSPGARYDNLFVVFAAPRAPHTPEEAEKEIYSEIEKFVNAISQADINKILNKLESELVFGLDTNKGIARLISYYQTLFGSWEYAAGYMKAIKEVTVTDIRNTVKKYIVDKNRVVGILYDSRKK